MKMTILSRMKKRKMLVMKKRSAVLITFWTTLSMVSITFLSLNRQRSQDTRTLLSGVVRMLHQDLILIRPVSLLQNSILFVCGLIRFMDSSRRRESC